LTNLLKAQNITYIFTLIK